MEKKLSLQTLENKCFQAIGFETVSLVLKVQSFNVQTLSHSLDK